MTTLVLTVIGDDRAGLVSALADVVDEHGGSWGDSQLAELAGTFAGILTVEVAPDRVQAFTAALEPLSGVLRTTVHTGADAGRTAEGPVHHLELMGNDHPGIVRRISGALAEQGVSIASMETRTVPTPESGGQTFEAQITLRPSAAADLDGLRAALEALASDLMVDITLDEQRGQS
jgi:glycine cleavage system regulatory protein